MVIPWWDLASANYSRKLSPMVSQIRGFYHTRIRIRCQNKIIVCRPFGPIEGLRLDEAMHPLCILAVGLYRQSAAQSKRCPTATGTVKYGFKSIKSIAAITLTEKQPPTSWNQLAPQEYGFYANVKSASRSPALEPGQKSDACPTVCCPNIVPTQLFNGYAEQVASLYSNLDMKNF